ncbi:hypothetical protein LCGC14_2266120 [marine sediment metagenome]|uniref:Uncharacterized protein n=1 Tax=marine sediment metagenome TaxID=412755 RepID=A0A0F9CYJ9_9ZZZZ
MAWFKKACVTEKTLKKIDSLKADIKSLEAERLTLFEACYGKGELMLCVRTSKSYDKPVPVFKFEMASDISPDFINEVLARCDKRIKEKKQELIGLGMCPGDVKRLGI